MKDLKEYLGTILIIIFSIFLLWFSFAAVAFKIRHPKANEFAPYHYFFEVLKFETVEDLK